MCQIEAEALEALEICYVHVRYHNTPTLPVMSSINETV